MPRRSPTQLLLQSASHLFVVLAFAGHTANAQGWAIGASGTNVTGAVERFYFSPPSCEADACIAACTSLLSNSFSTSVGGFTAYINPIIFPTSIPDGCSCEATCSAQLPGAGTSTFDAALIKLYDTNNAYNLTFTCTSGLRIVTTISDSFAPTLEQLDIQFPVGFAGSATSCLASYAVLPVSRASPPIDWFLGLSYAECVDPPLGVAQQVQLTPNGCAADSCLAACSGKLNGLLYYNLMNMSMFYYQWVFQPAVGTTIPANCDCGKYNCLFQAQGPSALASSASRISGFNAITSSLLSGPGVPFYCGNYTPNGNPDFRVTVQNYGTPAKKGVAVQWSRPGCAAVYAVSAGLVFNVSQKTSIGLAPMRADESTDNKGLSSTAKIIIIVVVVVIGSLLMVLCGALYYMYKRERRGEPLFSRLEEVEMEGSG